jgi:surface polysaccharide O-acyltransferase-like enzyme
MQRRYDIDWLRTIIVLTIIPFHAFVMFDQNPKAIMYIKDKVNVVAFNNIGGVIDRFHMVTLFLLSGIAIYYSLQNRNVKSFLSDRFKKLFLPLIMGSILLNPVMTYFWSINQGRNESFLKHYIGFFTKNVGGFEGLNGGYTPAHLWFILYLLVFSFIGLPFFLWLKSIKSEKIRNSLAGFFSKSMTLILLAIPYCSAYLIEILDEKNPIAYLYVVFMGCIFATDENYIKALKRDKWIYLTMSILLYILFFRFKNISFSNMLELYSFAFLVKFLKIIPAYALMGLFSSYINKDSKLLKYLSNACYPIYVIHMVILTAIGFIVIKFNLAPALKFVAIVVLTYAVCFSMYEVLRRIPCVGLLIGISDKNKSKAAVTDADVILPKETHSKWT